MVMVFAIISIGTMVIFLYDRTAIITTMTITTIMTTIITRGITIGTVQAFARGMPEVTVTMTETETTAEDLIQRTGSHARVAADLIGKIKVSQLLTAGSRIAIREE